MAPKARTRPAEQGGGATDTANSLGEDFLAREKVRLLQKPYAAEELFAAIRNAIDPP